MPSKLLPKHVWRNAIGASKKPKRLHLVSDAEGQYHCPVEICDSNPFYSQRGCRKHVYGRHGWFYYFDKRPNIEEVLPAHKTRNNKITKSKRSSTNKMPMFLKTCKVGKLFKNWLMSAGGGSKSENQADQINCRTLKFLKYCCDDVDFSWEITDAVVDYCFGSVTLISDFVAYLKDLWKVGYAGIIGYMNSLSHFLDFRRVNGINKDSVAIFLAVEIYISRVKKTLSKNMRAEWNILLSVDYLEKINCWASLEDLQQVIPFHGDKFAQILLNSSDKTVFIPPHDLSFCTAYIIAVLFLMVKASRPMTYQFLTVTMIESIGDEGIVDQTAFKTKEKYGFDSLIFSKDVVHILRGYITCIRPRLNPACDYLLISRNGTQLCRLSDVFGRLVFQAIGKYINPTRYRQIIETESAERLSVDEQNALSEDQKHTSLVAKVHYQKMNSRIVAEKGRQSMDKLRDPSISLNAIRNVNEVTTSATDFVVENRTLHGEIKNSENNSVLLVGNNGEKRQKKASFSSIEDKFLLDGIKKYGAGKWTSILHDPSYAFHTSRKAATLCTRAKLKHFV